MKMTPKFKAGDRVRYVKVDDVGAVYEYGKEFTIFGVDGNFNDINQIHYRVVEKMGFFPSEHRLVLVSSSGCKHSCAPCKGNECGFFEKRD
jgi:hypothetical protein